MVTQTRKIKPLIGYMSQKFSLYKDMTVKENIELYAGLYKVPKGRLSARKNWVLGMAGLEGKDNIMTRDLSGAWMQRLALGCAIIHEPEILFLDEPTAGVDPISRRNFWDLIYELSIVKGVTVFVTTHYMDEAEHCNSLGLIYGGQLIAMGSPQELKTGSIAEELLEIECQAPIRAFELLSAHPSLARISLFGHKLHLLTDKIEGNKALIEDVLTKGQIELMSIAPAPLTLEDVFLALIEKEETKSAHS
jgi:ABC-2 type transport system ATP-binding protein